MFDVGYYKIPVGPYHDYQVFFRRKNREKFKSAVCGNPYVALGLLLVMNREHISKPGSELRRVLDVAAELDLPGLAALGEGIRYRKEWATRLLPESSWSFPEEFLSKDPPSEVTLATLIAKSEERRDEGRKLKAQDDQKHRRLNKWFSGVFRVSSE